MKIAIVGSREFKDNSFISQIMIKEFAGKCNEDMFISGGATGADSVSELCIDDFNENFNAQIKKKIFKPDWDKYGKRAGAIRNQKIVDEADKVIAFWDGQSKGTKITIDMAKKKGIPVDIYIRK